MGIAYCVLSKGFDLTSFLILSGQNVDHFMKKILTFIFCIQIHLFSGCVGPDSYEDTKEFYFKNKINLNLLLEKLKKSKIHWTFRDSNKHIFLKFTQWEDLQINLQNSKNEKDFGAFFLNTNFNENDPEVLKIKNQFNIDYSEVKEICNLFLSLDSGFLTYYYDKEKEYLLVNNLVHFKYAELPQESKLIEGNWSYDGIPPGNF